MKKDLSRRCNTEYGRGKNPNSRNGFKAGHTINVGRVCSEQKKQRISETKHGRPNGLAGRTYSQAHRDAISRGAKGKKKGPMSLNGRLNISQSKKGKSPSNIEWLHAFN